MQKDQSYHESAIKYNEGLAEAAEILAPTIEHPEVQRWCTAVGKQHRFHAKRHQAALDKIIIRGSGVEEVEILSDGLDVPELVEGIDVDQLEATEPDLSPSVEEELNTFSDGCVNSHKPLETANCDFSPNKVVPNA